MKKMKESGSILIAAVFLACVLMSGTCGAYAASSNTSKTTKPPKPKGFMATAANGKITATWEKSKGADCYVLYQATSGQRLKKAAIKKLKFVKVKTVKSKKATISGLKKGYDYHYYVVAGKSSAGKTAAAQNGSAKKIYSKKSVIRSATLPASGRSTIKNLLRTGLAPVGSTLYVWGGGWNKADNGTGKTAKRKGLYPAWRSFYNKYKKGYNFRKHRYKITKGLDCSGFVGWSVYNIMETANNKPGYVTWAVGQGKMFASKGFGKYVASSKVKKHKAGDIMTCSTHVWMAVGDCSDGSTVILHASPPAPSLAGTPAKDGTKESEAVILARTYMKKYYKKMYNSYGNAIVRRGSDYRTNYGRFRWNEKTLADPEGYRKMKAGAVLADLFGER